MPTTTGTQGLTIPVSTDFVEDQPVYLAQMTGQMEDRFNAHDDDALRVQPRPIAVIDCTLVQTYTLSVVNQYDRMIKFDTVMVDTAGMVDLVSSPWAIAFPELGWYRFVCYAKINSTGCTGPGCVTLTCSARGSGLVLGANGDQAFNEAVELNATGTTSMNVAQDLVCKRLGSSFGYGQFLLDGTSCSSTVTMAYARMALYKVSDL